MRLLSKYFHGKTQNASKSIGSVAQTKFPQNIYVQHNDLEMGVLCNDNDIIKSFKKC